MFEKIAKKQNFRFFWQQATAFAGIFLILGLIVISILKQSTYNGVDHDLNEVSKHPEYFLPKNSEIFYYRDSSEGAQNHFLNFDTTINIGFFADDGTFYPVDNDLNLKKMFSKVKLKELEVGKISQFKVKDTYGVEQTLRYKMKSVPDTIKTNLKTKYLIIFTGVNQVTRVTNNAIKIVIYCMMIFYLLSLLISFFLAHLFMKPILRSWQKQQEFVENASHELRTPLAVVQNKLELFFTKPQDKIITHSSEIGTALSEIRRMRQLTSDLLILARSDIEQIVINKTEFNAITTITNLVKDYQLLAESNDKKIKLVIAPDFPEKIVTDSKLIQQLLVILLDNALKYTPNKGEIEIILTANSHDLTIAVKDNGQGIPNEKKQIIFERFTRVDSARNRETGGFGLGLSLAYQITKSLAGKISVIDNLPKGSIFKIVLPFGK